MPRGHLVRRARFCKVRRSCNGFYRLSSRRSRVLPSDEIFPIMHLVVLRRAIYEQDPSLAVRLTQGFEAAKQLAFEAYEGACRRCLGRVGFRSMPGKYLG